MEFKGLGITFICNRCLKEIQIALDLPIGARHLVTPFPCNIVYMMRRNHHNCFLCYNCYNFVNQPSHETTNTLSRYPNFLHVNPAWQNTGLTHAEYRLRIRKQAANLSYMTYLCSLIMLAGVETKSIEHDNLNQNPIAPQVQTLDLWNINSPISSDNTLVQPTSESNEFVSVEMIRHAEEWKPQSKLKPYKCVGDEIRGREPQLTLESNDVVSVEMIQNVEECEPQPLQQSNDLFSIDMIQSDEVVDVFEPRPKLEFTELFPVDSIENVEECELKRTEMIDNVEAYEPQPIVAFTEFSAIDLIQNVEEYVQKSYKFAGTEITPTISEPQFTLESNDLVSVEMIQNEECEQQPTLQSNNLFNLNMMLAKLELDEFMAGKKNPRVTEPTLESNELVGDEIIQNIDELDLQTINPEELISDEMIEDVQLYKSQAKLESTQLTAVDSIQNVDEYEQKPTFESSESKLKCVGDEMTENISGPEPQFTLESNDLVSVEIIQNIGGCEPILQSNQLLTRLESDEFVAVKLVPRESEVINVEMCASQHKLEFKELAAADIIQSDEECKNQRTIESEELIRIELMENIEACNSQPELESDEFISVEMYVGEYDTQSKLELVSTEQSEPQPTLKPHKFDNIKMTDNVLVYEHQPILESDVSVSVEMIQTLATRPISESDEFIDVIESVEEPTKDSDEFISVEIQNTEEYELQPRLESKVVDEDKSNEFISVQIIENPEECESQPTLQSSEFVRIEMIQNVEDCELQSRLEVDELDVDVMQIAQECETQSHKSASLGEFVAVDVFPNVKDCKSSELDESILNLDECKGQSTSNELDNKKTIQNNEESDDQIPYIEEWKTACTFNEMFPNVEGQATSESDEFLSVKMLPVINKCKQQHKFCSSDSVGVEIINEDDQSDTDSHRTYVIDFVPYVRRPRVCWEPETLSDEEHDDAKIFWAWKRRCPVVHELHRSPAQTNLQTLNTANVQPENEASAPLNLQHSPECLWVEDISFQSDNNHTTTLEVRDNQDSRLRLDLLEEPWSPRARIQDWIYTHASTSTSSNTRNAPDANDWILKNHKFRRSSNVNKPPILMPPQSDLPVTLIDISDESS